MTDTLEILDNSGHLTLTWDPTNKEQVQKAREEVERLRAAGYSFFAVVGADEVAAGNGTLVVRRIEDPVEPVEVLPKEKEKPRRRNVAVRPMAGG